MRSNESFRELLEKSKDVEQFCHLEEATNHAHTMFLVIEELRALRREVWERNRKLKSVETKVKKIIESVSESLDS